MSTLKTLVGIGTEPTIGGVEYRLGPLTRADWALIEAEIRKRRGDPVATARELAKGQPTELARELLQQAYSDAKRIDVVTAGELDAWSASLEGYTFNFWLQAKKHQPKMTLHEAGDLLEQYGKEYVDRLVEAMAEKFPDASQDEILGCALELEDAPAIRQLVAQNMGLPEGNSPPPETPGEKTSPFPGPNGTPESEKPTDGISSSKTG